MINPIRWLQTRIRRYFGFSRSETNGTVFLLLLLLCVFCAVELMPIWLQSPSFTTDTSTTRHLDALATKLSEQFARPPKAPASTGTRPASDKLPAFDPNVASVELLREVGLPEWLAKRIIKYRNAGGQFKVKNDLAKIYGMPEALFASIKHLVALPDKLPERVPEKSLASTEVRKVYQPKKLVSFDLNLADTTALKQVKGIGSKLSARIISYRQSLGGYHSLDQLQEVWGLADSVVVKLTALARLSDTVTIRPLLLNTASAIELKKHPYIDWSLAKKLERYREQHGPYQSTEALYGLYGIDSATVERLQPYLQFSSQSKQAGQE